MNRGLTLIEVVISAALLALMAAAVMPIFRDAAQQQTATEPVSADGFQALSTALDAWLGERDAETITTDSLTVLGLDGMEFRVQRSPDAPDWVVARRGAAVVLRFSPLPLEEDES